MNLEQAKEKLNGVANGTATKHSKVLIAELCSVIKFLMDELDRIKTPPLVSLSKKSRHELDTGKYHKNPTTSQPPWPNRPYGSPQKSPPVFDPIEKHRRGNAGDAK